MTTDVTCPSDAAAELKELKALLADLTLPLFLASRILDETDETAIGTDRFDRSEMSGEHFTAFRNAVESIVSKRLDALIGLTVAANAPERGRSCYNCARFGTVFFKLASSDILLCKSCAEDAWFNVTSDELEV